MDEFDLIVIGSGAGMNILDAASRSGMHCALVENGPLGGTCLNRGCIPSKMWVYPADVIRKMQDAADIGVHVTIDRLDFGVVRERTWGLVLHDRKHIEEAVKADPNIRLFSGTGKFVGDRTIQIGNDVIHAQKVVISAGARSFIPEVAGLASIPYLTSENVFDLTVLPKSLIILGGGFKACEFGHFFSAFGTRVTIIQRNSRLLAKEEPEISTIVHRGLGRHVRIELNSEVTAVRRSGSEVEVNYKDHKTGVEGMEIAEQVMVCIGECSNADLLQVDKTGVKLDEQGFVEVNQYLETSAPGVWAFGDITGKHLFRHTANYESQVVWNNLVRKERAGTDEHAIPHAVYTYPTVGSVGLTEELAVKYGFKVLIGYNQYTNVAKGNAMREENTIVKVLVEKGTWRILGASIAGSEADILVQQIVYLMNAGDESYAPMARAQVIHPALSEVLVGAFAQLMDPEEEKHDH